MARLDSPRYTILFATAVCVVCALMVSVAAVALQPRQKANARLYMEKNVLLAAGLVQPGADLSEREVETIFEKGIRARLVDFATGELLPADKIDARAYDQRARATTRAPSRVAPPNNAGIGRMPNYGVVYFVMKDDEVEQVVIAVEGLGMWGTIYGFLALAPDGNTVRGLTYYDQKETPGPGRRDRQPELAGAVARPQGLRRPVGRRGITVIKGQAGPPETDPLRVDGLSGATITSNAITRLMQFWLSDDGYGKFLKRFREGAIT